MWLPGMTWVTGVRLCEWSANVSSPERQRQTVLLDAGSDVTLLHSLLSSWLDRLYLLHYKSPTALSHMRHIPVESAPFFVLSTSFCSGVKDRGSDRWWERRWWLWWGDMRKMRWTRRTVNRMRLAQWRRELIPQVWDACERAVGDLTKSRGPRTEPTVTSKQCTYHSISRGLSDWVYVHVARSDRSLLRPIIRVPFHSGWIWDQCCLLFVNHMTSSCADLELQLVASPVYIDNTQMMYGSCHLLQLVDRRRVCMNGSLTKLQLNSNKTAMRGILIMLSCIITYKKAVL